MSIHSSVLNRSRRIDTQDQGGLSLTITLIHFNKGE